MAMATCVWIVLLFGAFQSLSSVSGRGITRRDLEDAKFMAKRIKATDQETSFSFDTTYDSPIVVVGALSYAGNNPAFGTISAVNSNDFSVRIEEYDYLDGSHKPENLHYMVVEEGFWQSEHFTIAAGSVMVSTASKTVVDLPEGRFPADSVVFVSTVTDTHDAAYYTRVTDITRDSFAIKLQAQSTDFPEGSETVHWIALNPGRVGSVVISTGETAMLETGHITRKSGFAPSKFARSSRKVAFLAQIQTINGEDPATLRYRNLGQTSVELSIQEETFSDAETDHIKEQVGFAVLSLPKNPVPVSVRRITLTNDLVDLGISDLGFVDPIVIVKPASFFSDATPTSIRLTSDFRGQIQFFGPSNSAPEFEEATMLVVESGSHGFDLTRMQAGSTSAGEDWVTVPFPNTYDSPPVVITSVIDDVGNEVVTSRIKDVTPTSFDVRAQVQESDSLQASLYRINYLTVAANRAGIIPSTLSTQQPIPFETGITKNIASTFTPIFPGMVLRERRYCLLGDVQTFQGKDPIIIRHAFGSYFDENREVGFGPGFNTQEERSRDSEVNHVLEHVGWIYMDCFQT